MFELPRALAVAGGLLLVLVILGDAIGTLIVTRARTGRWRPTRLWYGATWRLTRGAATRLPVRAGDFALNVYPAVSLLGLLVLWLTGLGQTIDGSDDWGTLVYYAGTSLLTPAFGTAHGTRFGY